MSAETKAQRIGLVPNIIAGLATGMFSIPEGMAYAQLAGVNPKVHETLKKSGALDVLSAENVFPATKRVLAIENAAWHAAQQWLQAHQTATP